MKSYKCFNSSLRGNLLFAVIALIFLEIKIDSVNEKKSEMCLLNTQKECSH